MMAAAEGCFRGVEVMDIAIGQAFEDADGWMLIVVAAFHVEVAVERVGIAGEQADLAPTASMASGTKFFQRSARDQDKVNLVSDVVGNGVVTVSPHAAHRTGAVVLGRVHQMVNDEAVLALLK